MPLITIPATIGYNNYVGNIKVAKVSATGTYDASLYMGEGNSYSNNIYPTIESGLLHSGGMVSSTKSLLSFPISTPVPTTLDAIYGPGVIVNSVTLSIGGVKSSSATPEGIKVNFYYVDVPSDIAVEAATPGNTLSASSGKLYTKKNSFKLGSVTTPIISDFVVTLDNAFYYYIKDKEYFYIIIETEDQEYNHAYLNLQGGQERRLISTESVCSAVITINYTAGVSRYTECNYTLSSNSLYFGQPGGSSIVGITSIPQGSCLGGAWAVTNPYEYPWLSFSQIEGFGPDDASILITAADNSSDISRTATIYINDLPLVILQSGFVGIGCDYSIDPSVPPIYYVSSSAGVLHIPVTRDPSDCNTGSLIPTSSASWARPAGFAVRGSVPVTARDFTLSYADNSAQGSVERSTLITVGSTSFTLVQSNTDTDCGAFSPSLYSVSIPYLADTRTLDIVGAPSGCTTGRWSLVSNVSWIQINTPSGYGPGKASFSISANSSFVARMGTMSFINLDNPLLPKAITITQAGLGAGVVPPAPDLVSAVLLSNNVTAKISVVTSTPNVTGLYYRAIYNGTPGNWNTMSYLNPFNVTGLVAGVQYYFDVCLIVGGTVGYPTRTIIPIQPALFPPSSGTGGIVGAKNVRASYDPITDSVLLTWDLNGQVNLTGYKINYYPSSGGVAYSLYTSLSSGSSYTITDLSGFNRDLTYIFSVALVKGSEVSPYSPSNPLFIPLSQATGLELKLVPKLFYYPYPNTESSEYKQITHLVNRKTTGTDTIDYYTLYLYDTVDALYADDPLRAGFVNSVFSLTNSYNDKTTASTTWNYENRVGLFYFELPVDSYIENPYLYFYFAPEPMGIPFDSDNVYFDLYAIPNNLIEEVGDQLRVSKKAYTTSIYTPRIIDENNRVHIKDIKTNNSVVIKVPIKIQNDAVYITASGKKILPIKAAITLPRDFSLPTGFNAVAFTKVINSVPANNSGIGFSGSVSYIDRPVDFRIRPASGDIEIYWSAPTMSEQSTSPITHYEVTSSAPGFGLPVVRRIPVSSPHDVTPYTLSEMLIGTGHSISTSITYTIKMRSLTGVPTDTSAYTYSLSAVPGVANTQLPLPPLNIDAFYGPEKVFVSWDAPNANLTTPIYKFNIHVTGGDGVAVPTIYSYIDQNNIKYEKYGIELNKTNAGITNGVLYLFSVSSVSAEGESYTQLSTSVLPNAIERQQVIDNDKYKVFYEQPVELIDPATKGQPIYPEYVDGHSSIFGDLVDKYDYLLASKDVGSSVTFTDVKNICRIKVGHFTGEDGIFIVNLPVGTFTYPAVLQFIHSAISSNIYNGEVLPIIAGMASANRIFIQHVYTDMDATLDFVAGYNDANSLVFGLEPIVASPNIIIKAENYVPTVEYDKTALRSLSDSRPYRRVVKRFDIVPASKTPSSTTKYPLYFNLNEDKRVQDGNKQILLTNQYDDIRVGSVLIEWYVNDVKESLFDNGDGYLLSLPKVDACGNKVPSQALGVLDYASGIISCNLPNITSGYVVITYLINEKVSNPQEYVWMPTSHYALELNMYEPIFFTYPHYAYMMQNQAKLKPGYTTLDYLKINANITSDLTDIGSSLNIDIE